jgi:hypothetical protein
MVRKIGLFTIYLPPQASIIHKAGICNGMKKEQAQQDLQNVVQGGHSLQTLIYNL